MLNSKVRSRPISTATNPPIMVLTTTLEGPEAMSAFGHSLARLLKGGDVITLRGGLGAGKSTLARGLISHILEDAGLASDDIPSPTFTLVQPYPWPDETDAGREIWHFDLWRLDGPDEVIELGFDEALSRHAMIIEWPDRLAGLLPDAALQIEIEPIDDGAARVLSLKGGEAADWPQRLGTLAL